MVYAKHMAKHSLGIHQQWLQQGRHVLLVRHPLAVIRSFGQVLQPTLQETCYPALCELYSTLRTLHGYDIERAVDASITLPL